MLKSITVYREYLKYMLIESFTDEDIKTYSDLLSAYFQQVSDSSKDKTQVTSLLLLQLECFKHKCTTTKHSTRYLKSGFY